MSSSSRPSGKPNRRSDILRAAEKLMRSRGFLVSLQGRFLKRYAARRARAISVRTWSVIRREAT